MRGTSLLLLVFALFGSHVAGAQPTARTVITIAHAGPISPSVSLPLAIANEHGIFAKYGLEARLIGAFPGAAGLIGKEAEFGYFGSAAILLAITEHRTDLRILGAVNNGRISFHLVSAPDIKKPQDLRGKRIGVFSVGTGIWVASIQVLQQLGLDPVQDKITFLPVGNVTAVAKALEEGKIDAGMLSPVQSKEMQTKGFSVLFDTNAVNMYGAQSLPVTTAAYLEQHPETVEKFVTALVEAIAFSLDPGRKPDVLTTIQRMFSLPDMAAAERVYEDVSNLNRKPYPSIDSLKRVQNIVALHDQRILGLNVEALIEDRFLCKLDQSGKMD
jgi:ABC-type nitrate/sulfonate/bicarbonate transport system substrate-binding protein